MDAVNESKSLVKRLRDAGWEKQSLLPHDDECWMLHSGYDSDSDDDDDDDYPF